MRLINADKLIEEGYVLTRHGTSNRVITTKSIADVPTAFDVDKVVEQIKGWSVKQHMPIANGSLGYVEYEVVNSDKAIELIKAGGVNV